MATRGGRGIHSFPTIIHTHPSLFVLILLSLWVGGFTARAQGDLNTEKGHWPASTNSCVITGVSNSTKASDVFRTSVANYWALGSAAVRDSDASFDDPDMDQEQFELHHIDRLHHTLYWAECLNNDWPAIDLPWCSPDWQGKMIPESM